MPDNQIDPAKLTAIEQELDSPAATVLRDALLAESQYLRDAFTAAADRIVKKHISKGADPEAVYSVYTLLLSQADWRTSTTPEQLKAALQLRQPVALVKLRNLMAKRVLQAAAEVGTDA